MTINISHHCSLVLVEAGELIILSGYDDTYPTPEMRGKVQFLGGNQTKSDKTPRGILEREVDEEVNYPLDFKERERLVGYAAKSEIDELRYEILKNATPFKDFLIQGPVVKRTLNTPEDLTRAVASVYRSKIPYNLMLDTKVNLIHGMKMASEGVLHVVTKDDLITSKESAAWAAPLMLSYCLDITVPNPLHSYCVPIGEPRDKLEDYLNDFKCLK